MTKVLTRFFIRTREIKIIRRQRYSVRTYCEHCDREVSMLAPDDAAFLVCKDTEEIYSWINSKKIHFSYLNGGKLFICLASLCLV